MKNYFFLSLLVLVVISCNKKDEYDGVNCSTINAKFAADIQPIINASCMGSGCHGAGSSKGDFTTYDGVKHKVDEGSFANRVLYKKSMPKGGELSFEKRSQIKCWIDSGAPNN